MTSIPEKADEAQSKTSWLRIALRWLVTAGLVTWLIQKVDFTDVGAKLSAVNPFWIAAAFVALVASQVASSTRWWLLARACALESRLGRMISMYFEGMFASLCLPSTVGGDLIKVVRLGGKKHKTLAAATVLGDRAAGFVALLVLLGIALLVDEHQRPALRRSAGAVVAIGLTAVVLLALAPKVPALRRLLEHRVLRPLALLHRAPWLSVLLWGVVVQSLAIAQVGCIAQAFGVSVSIATLTIATTLTGVAAALPISFSGIGLRTAAMPALLAAEGVSEGSGVAMGLTMDALFVAAGLLGGFAHLHEQHLAGRERSNKQPPKA
jgi:glycosyltransferase 2 family protein